MTGLIVTLVLGVLPAWYLAHRLDWLRRRAVRWLAGVLSLLAVAWAAPWQGVDFSEIKQLSLLLASGLAIVLLLRHERVAWFLNPGRLRTVLAAWAGLALVAYLNFFSFHGERTFVHLHDVAHYYLGSKYYAELGYTDLYTAMLRAEAETHDNRFKAIEARDLATYERVHIRTLLQKSESVKEAFTPQRWAEFQGDVDYFRQSLDRYYGTVLLDHGFNPTPVWALIGGALADLVPGGSERGILLLTLLDPLLLVLLALWIGRTFGVRIALLAVIYFSILFGATFGWTGGAFLRFPWLVGVLGGLCQLHRRRYASAGALFAMASLLRVFPAFFLVPVACKAAVLTWRRRAIPQRYLRLFGSFALTGLIGLALTGLLPRSFDHWLEFRANMANHVRNISPNVVGLTEALSVQPGLGDVTAEEFEALKERRQTIYNWQLALVALPLLVWIAWRSPRQTDLSAAVLGMPLLYAGLSLAAYYYVFLVGLLFVERSNYRHLALIFAVEAASYALLLFEEREGMLFVYRGLLVAFLFVALNLRAPARRIEEALPNP